MTSKWLLGEALDWKTQFGLSASFALVLGLSLAVPIDVCAVGEHGDVSALLQTAWTVATGSATLVSFALAVGKYRAETSGTAPDESTDSHTAIHVESAEGDVDLNVTLGDERDEGRTTRSARRADDSSEPTDGSDHDSGDSSEPSGE